MSTMTRDSASPPAAIEQVGEKFFSLHKRYVLTRSVCEAATLITAGLVFWLVLALLDYVFELSLVTRQTSLGFLTFAAFVWAAFRVRAVMADANRKHFAGILESRFTDFGQRLRTILDSIEGRVSGPTEMLSALGNQALGRWETSAPRHILPVRTTAVACGALLTIAASIGLLSRHAEWSTALQRTIGQDQPYTHLLVTTEDFRVIEGESIEVELLLAGRTDRDVMVRYRHAAVEHTANPDSQHAEWNEIDLQPLDIEGASSTTAPASTNAEPSVRFTTSLGRATQNLEYQFVTSAGDSRIFDVTVQPLVVVLEHSVTVTSPAYTRLEPRTFDDKKDVSVLAASVTNYRIRTSHPLDGNRLLVGSKKGSLELTDLLRKTDDPAVWEFSLPTQQSVHWRFEGSSPDGVPLDPISGRLRIRRDQAPKIKWRGPKNEINVHTLTEVPMEVDVTDDFGLTECGVVFQLGDEEEFVLTDWLANPAADQQSTEMPSRRQRLAEILPLESFGLSQFDFVAYYAYAVDNREGQLQRSESDIRYIDIRPLRQFFSQADPDQGSGQGGGGGFATSLSEVIRRQRALINRTRRLIRETNVSTSVSQHLGSLDSLVQTQSELAGFVNFIIRRLTERGFDDNLDALSRAESSMLQAADSLAVAEFVLAQSQQQDAMRALVEAQDDLRQLLISNKSQASQSALRAIARELRQKLRLEPEASDMQLAHKLRKIAQDQRALGLEAVSIQSAAAKMTTEANAPKSEPSDDDAMDQDAAGEPSDDGISKGAAEEEQLGERLSAAMDKQVHLQDELRAVADDLSDKILESELVAQRMTAAIDSMAELENPLRSQEADQFKASSYTLALDLEELALLIESLSQLEPVDRVAALRDLAAMLAEMEREQLPSTQEASGKGRTRAPASSGDGTSPPQEDYQEDASESNAQARSIAARAETTEEVLRSISRLTEDEAGEIADQISQFVEDAEFLDTLSATRQAVAEQMSELEAGPSDQEASEQGSARVSDYVDASVQLDAIYRRLIAPQLERLRDLELQAEELRESIEDATEPGAEQLLELRDLAQQLSEAGFSELAEALGNGISEDGVGGDQLNFTLKAIRVRIQEMIRRETTTDRSVAIPSKFRDLVDRYFRALAGEEIESEESPAN